MGGEVEPKKWMIPSDNYYSPNIYTLVDKMNSIPFILTDSGQSNNRLSSSGTHAASSLKYTRPVI